MSGNKGGLGMAENDSAQNLISKAQIHEVIKGINVSNLDPFWLIFYYRTAKDFLTTKIWDSWMEATLLVRLTMTKSFHSMRKDPLSVSTLQRWDLHLLPMSMKRVLPSTEPSWEKWQPRRTSLYENWPVWRKTWNKCAMRKTNLTTFLNLSGKTSKWLFSSKKWSTHQPSRTSETYKREKLMSFQHFKRNLSSISKNWALTNFWSLKKHMLISRPKRIRAWKNSFKSKSMRHYKLIWETLSSTSMKIKNLALSWFN